MSSDAAHGTTWRNLGAVFHTLLSGWAVSLVVRFLAPRALGPEAFGLYASFDALAQMLLVIVSWGFLEWSARRAAEDPGFFETHAAAVLQGAIALCVPALVLIVVAAAALGHAPATWPFFLGVGLWALLGEANVVALRLRQLQGDYHASGRLTRRYRLAWGFGAVIALGACAGRAITPGAAIASLAIVGVVAEAARLAHLIALSRVRVFPPVPRKALRAVLGESFPFFTNRVLVAAYLRAPALLLGSSFVAGGLAQMGHYGVALTVNNIILMFVPALQSVLLPSLARAHPTPIYGDTLARALTIVLLASGFVSGGLICLARPFVSLAFGAAYAPAAAVVGVTAPTLVVTYVLVLLNFHLILEGREKQLARWSFAGLLVTVGAALAFLRADLFPSKAVAAAAASTATELFLLFVFLRLGRPRSWMAPPFVRALILVACSLGAAYGVDAAFGDGPLLPALAAAAAWTLAFAGGAALTCGRYVRDTLVAWRNA